MGRQEGTPGRGYANANPVLQGTTDTTVIYPRSVSMDNISTRKRRGVYATRVMGGIC